MGADFILSHIWTMKKDEEIDWDAGIRAIDILAFDDVQDILSFLEEDDYASLDAERAAMESEVRPQLRADWAEFRALWTGPMPRDADLCTFGPVKVLLSGGMSWGDSPTDTFDLLYRLQQVPLRAAGFFDD